MEFHTLNKKTQYKISGFATQNYFITYLDYNFKLLKDNIFILSKNLLIN